MTNFINTTTGTTLTTEQRGSTFISTMTFKADHRREAETVVRRHRSWLSVEQLAARYNMVQHAA